MTAPERLAKVAEVLHHEGWPVEPGWKLTPDTCGTCATTLRLAEALAPLLDEFQAEDEIAGQMKHITAEVARGDVPLSDAEELIAALRARVSHAEAERDEAFRVAPGMGVAVYERGKRDGAARVREAVEALYRSEVARLTTPERPDPYRSPMLANWLGGLKTALDAAEKAAVEGVAGAVAGEDAQSGRGDAGGAGGGTGAHKGSCAICGWKWERGCPA